MMKNLLISMVLPFILPLSVMAKPIDVPIASFPDCRPDFDYPTVYEYGIMSDDGKEKKPPIKIIILIPVQAIEDYKATPETRKPPRLFPMGHLTGDKEPVKIYFNSDWTTEE